MSRKPKKKKQGKSQRRNKSVSKTTTTSQALFGRAVAFHQSGNLHEAKTLYEQILSQTPDHPDALHYLGLFHFQTGAMKTAVTLMEQAIQINGANPVFWGNLGVVRRSMGDLLQSRADLEKALSLDSRFVDAWNNLAATLKDMGDPKKAAECCRKALELQPDAAAVYNNLGAALQDLGDFDGAVEAFEKALALNSNCADAFRSIVFQYKKTCSWRKFDEMLKRMGDFAAHDELGAARPVYDPFVALSATDDPKVNFKVAQNWSRYIQRTVPKERPVFSFKHNRFKDKITIGYLSGDFRDHPVAQLVCGLFERHDRKRFRVHGYAISRDDGSVLRRRIEAGCDRFVNLFGIEDVEAAELIYNDRVDILVDLNGFTRGGRPSILALKPAPIQVNWLGFPGTMGAGFMDYIITDRIVTPPENISFVSENIVYMPHTYMVTDDQQSVGETPGRIEFGLPETSVVFASFNAPYKFDPFMFRIWMNILSRTPESVLWLANMSEQTIKNLKHEAELKGIDQGRLIFSKRVPARSGHLARIRLADLVLDTQIYNGHASTLDALWAGVPVLTLPGCHFASRVASSLLTALDMPELVMRDMEQYEQTAVRLGMDSQERSALREKLEHRRRRSPLFNTARFVKSLETAFSEMGRRYNSSAIGGRIELKEQPAKQNVITEKLTGALNVHQAGDFESAARMYRDVLSVDSQNADALHLHGVLEYQQGRYDSAISMIRKAISVNPGAAPFYCNLGLALKYSGKLEEAVNSFKKSLALDPKKPDTHNNLGTALKESGRSEEALESFKRAIQLKPTYFEAWMNAGNLAKSLERFDEAGDYYENALKLNPGHERIKKSLVVSLNNVGVAHQKNKHYDEAVAAFNRILEINPETAEAYGNLGNVYKDLGQTEKTLAFYRRALELKPELILIYDNMGTVHRLRGRPDLAEQCHREVLARDPENVSGLNNLGIALQDQGGYEDAVACFRKALAIDPENAFAYNNIGNMYYITGRRDLAKTNLKKAVELKPDYLEALNNLGIVHQFSGEIDKAIACYRKVIEQDESSEDAFRNLVHQLQYACAWDEVAHLSPELDRRTDASIAIGKKCAESPFENISRHDDPLRNMAVAKSWAENMIADAAVRFEFAGRKNREKRITIGYLSVDFRNHAVAHLILGMIRRHDRNRFRIVCASYGKNDNSPYRKRFETDADKFIDIERMSLQKGAEALYKEEVDILVDLTGHTGNNRMGICALKPAPVQVSWLGFPGTSGAAYMDYIITDHIVTPESNAPHYSEKFVLMPHCYLITDDEQPVSEKTFTRRELDLPENAMVYCSFNGAYKIEAVMFDIWMNILLQTPGSVLWLASPSGIAKRNLQREAVKRGVSADRLIFSRKMKSKADHLARIKAADLILDTRLYNGHASTIDALWAGTPVLTLQGNHFASRVASSILLAAALPELITHDLTEYQTLAVEFGRNPGKLEQIRDTLRNHRKNVPLFDTNGFVRSLESACETMWENYINDVPPEQIRVNTP